MCHIAERTRKATGVAFRVVGFDTGRVCQLPSGITEIIPSNGKKAITRWTLKSFAVLCQVLPNSLLEMSQTRRLEFLETVRADQPIGFVAVDVDYYSSAKAALSVFRSVAENYLPATLVYLDDIDHICSNEWAGELLAISEFNSENELRKIAPLALLRSLRIFKNPQWIDHIYVAHIFDHKIRSAGRPRGSYLISNEYVS